MTRHLAAALIALVPFAPGCSLIGPSCVSRQERGNVTMLNGLVLAGEVAMHQVRYETRGSQNDARIFWSDQSLPDGPRLNVYITRAECVEFVLPAENNTGSCSILSRAGSTATAIASSAIITHGRGNPERLGTPPDYKIWIVAGGNRGATYTIDITYFYGPDC